MKPLIIISMLLALATKNHAQAVQGNNPETRLMNSQIGIDSRNINNFKIPYRKTTHIVSPDPILYVDISSPDVEGDLPEKNIFRLKPNTAAVESGHTIGIDENFTVTIVTQTFITVYRLSFNREETKTDSIPSTAFILLIDPTKAIQLNDYRKVTNSDYDRLSIRAMSNKRKVFRVAAKQYGMELWLNNVYIIGDLMLFDLGAWNRTKLPYDLNGLDFKLADRYNVNATVSQEIEIKPLYSFTDDAGTVIDGKWRNFYILKKFTFPSQKVLKVQMTENQISGRPVMLSIDYDQILNSKSLIDAMGKTSIFSR